MAPCLEATHPVMSITRHSRVKSMDLRRLARPLLKSWTSTEMRSQLSEMRKCNSSTTWPKKLPTLETISQTKSSSKSDKNLTINCTELKKTWRRVTLLKRQKMQKYSKQSLFWKQRKQICISICSISRGELQSWSYKSVMRITDLKHRLLDDQWTISSFLKGQ